MTVTKEDILKIIEERETNIEDWINNNPLKLSISKLRAALTESRKEIIDARKFTKDNDPTFPKKELLCVYTLMNEYSAYRFYYITSYLYITKLEKMRTKSQKIPKK